MLDLVYTISIPQDLLNKTPKDKVMSYMVKKGIKKRNKRRQLLVDYTQSTRSNNEICRTVLNRFDDFAIFIDRCIATPLR